MKAIVVRYSKAYGKQEQEFCSVDEKKNLSLQVGMKVLVSNDQNTKIAKIIAIKEYEEEDLPPMVSKVVKIVTKKDMLQQIENEKESQKALLFAESQAKKLGLSMRFVDSYFTFDKKQLFLSYTADARVDFRELAKMLAQKYKTRIELRQIGVRDKAKKIGGVGPCGLFLCCNTFLTDFESVSISMAKNQFLALNPAKINGLCGRLLCCLNYEDEVYTELKKEYPDIGDLVETEHGLGKVTAVNILKQSYTVDIKEKGIIEIDKTKV